jgi:hypothetical protein
MGVMVEQASSTSTIKMYAVIDNSVILGPYVGTEEELKETKLNNPNYNFVEMTLENSPMKIGDIYNG